MGSSQRPRLTAALHKPFIHQKMFGLEPADAPFTTKIAEQSNDETHKAEGILEGESLPRVVLGVGVLVGAVLMPGNAPQCRVKPNILVRVTFFIFAF